MEYDDDGGKKDVRVEKIHPRFFKKNWHVYFYDKPHTYTHTYMHTRTNVNVVLC